MKIFRLFTIAAAALMMAACSSEENTLETQSPAAPGKLHFTATIATPDNGAGTRTEYSEQTDGTINVAWKENDKIAAIVTNSEGKYAKTELTVSKVNTDGSATITGDITKPKDDALTVDLIYPASIVTVDNDILSVSFDKMSNGTLDGTLKSIYENIDYRRADGCALTVSGDKATLTSAAKLESKLSIWKLTLQDDAATPNLLSASKVAIADGAGVMASATLTSAASEVYLPVLAGTGNICISATTADNDYFYMKEGVALAAKKYYQSEVKMTKGAHLAFLSADYEAKDGAILTGTLASNVKISIANNATVTLKDANINGSGTWTDGSYAGITCAGTATINLEGTNTVKGFINTYPGIYVPENETLTINGPGSLRASTGGTHGSGIGGFHWGSCGNITINGGTITAEGGAAAAAIGSGNASSCGDITITGGNVTAIGNINNTSDWRAVGIGCGDGYSADTNRAKCGNITISGGTVTATGKNGGVGIGSGLYGDCGTITITSGVTRVTATKGASAPNSIGAGSSGTCGTVTIGCTLDTDGNPVGGTTGAISTSPYTYDPSAPAAWAANEYNEASLDGTKVVFTKHSAMSVTAVANSDAAVTWSAGWYTVSGNVTITGNVTLGADTHLILQDDATLTINGQLNCRTNNKNLYIYGQKKGDGKLIVNNSGIAIYSKTGYRIDIHGGEVTAAATGDLKDGLFTGYLAVYGGKLTATSGGGNGIGFYNTIDVYDGEVVATSNATSSSFPFYGISNGGNANRILKVYGGKVTATGNGVPNMSDYGSGFGCYVQSGTSGIKFYFSDNGTDWDAGTSYASATQVGYAAATKKRYAKAE